MKMIGTRDLSAKQNKLDLERETLLIFSHMQAQSIQEEWGHVPLISKATGVDFPKPIRLTSHHHTHTSVPDMELQDLCMDDFCSG